MLLLDKIRKHLEQKKEVEIIKVNFRILVRELQLINRIGLYPSEISIKFIPYGYKMYFSISGICSYSNLENNKGYIKDCFGAYSISLENDRGHITLTIYNKPLEEREYRKILLNPYCLLLGYNHENETVITDMRISPHLLITGLSGQGKTGQARIIIANLLGLAEVYLLNCFKNDFRDFQGLKIINGNKEILSFLKIFKEKEFKEHDSPVYIVIDELMTLAEDKQIQQLLKEFLCVCRHYNIYIVGIIQAARAEDFKAKIFFNSRVSFKQIEKSSYSIALGTVGGLEELEKRQFYIKGSEGLQKAFTYTLSY